MPSIRDNPPPQNDTVRIDRGLNGAKELANDIRPDCEDGLEGLVACGRA